MLQRRARLTRKGLEDVIRRGKSFHSDKISLRVLKGNNNKTSSFSFVVSRKVAGRAHERNFLKRRGHYVMRGIIKDIIPSHSGVFFFKKGAADIRFEEFKKAIISLLSRAGILKNGKIKVSRCKHRGM